MVAPVLIRVYETWLILQKRIISKRLTKWMIEILSSTVFSSIKWWYQKRTLNLANTSMQNCAAELLKHLNDVEDGMVIEVSILTKNLTTK